MSKIEAELIESMPRMIEAVIKTKGAIQSNRFVMYLCIIIGSKSVPMTDHFKILTV